MENVVEVVKKKLWMYGYSVKDVSDIPGLGYDLLVEGKYQVKVFDGSAGNIEQIPRGRIVATVAGDEIRYNICKKGKCWEEVSPLKVFTKVED